MLRLDVLKAIIERALRDHPEPFTQEGPRFAWTGQTRVVSRQTERQYEPVVSITLETHPRLAPQVAACVCKPGVRLADLQIAAMVDTRLRGTIHVTGLPRGEEKHEVLKFLKKIEEAVEAPVK
ncbi:hypothetical protein [Alicyclobacillus sp.]|uniref:hypothetical protein n=1 Tax=Alicyclobacillus sp. TaxID=61169 RepID=UPI0025BC03A3|nr:hypothetical protein [Alicyclobacillus sp.]MCL6515873.1 hypothetical protein [Alicyclobacillus sp.]